MRAFELTCISEVELKHTICAAAIAAACSVPLSVSAANIVMNGTFDDTSVWALEIGNFVSQAGGIGGFPSIDTGPYYYGGSNANSRITQNYSLSGAEIAAAASGNLTYEMSADLFGFSSQGDNSFIFITFLNSLGNAIGGSSSLNSSTNDPGTWGTSFTAGDAPNFQSTSGSVTAGTESIDIFVGSTRTAGSSNDGYLDNAFVELTIETPTAPAIPLPAGGALLISGAALLAGLKRRKS